MSMRKSRAASVRHVIVPPNFASTGGVQLILQLSRGSRCCRPLYLDEAYLDVTEPLQGALATESRSG